MLRDPRLAAERWLRARARPGVEVEIAGNPHFQARPPDSVTVRITRPDEVVSRPRPPVGAIVLLSSIDWYHFAEDPMLRPLWGDPLRPLPPRGYGHQVEFRPGPLARLVQGLPVAPEIAAFMRDSSAPAAWSGEARAPAGLDQLPAEPEAEVPGGR